MKEINKTFLEFSKLENYQISRISQLEKLRVTNIQNFF